VIYCANPKLIDEKMTDEVLSSIQKVIASGEYILGEQVSIFEKNFSAYVNQTHGVGVNSGTDALILSLKALNIGLGDEVITVAHTALATVSAIIACGATPVLVDVDPLYFTIDPIKIKQAITRKTKAVIPVHIYGQAAEMDIISEISKVAGIYIIEDCAQATGAEYNGRKIGSMGTAGCFSFYPTKNLGGIGDGGMVVASDTNFASKVTSLRQYGWDNRRDASSTGLNSRLDELQAAILNIKLKYITCHNQQRSNLAHLYDNYLKAQGIKTPEVRSGSTHVYHLYVVQCDDRVAVQKKMNSKGIFPGIHYPKPIHFQSGYKNLCKIPDEGLPITEMLSNTILSLPMYPGLDEAKIKVISDCFMG